MLRGPAEREFPDVATRLGRGKLQLRGAAVDAQPNITVTMRRTLVLETCTSWSEPQRQCATNTAVLEGLKVSEGQTVLPGALAVDMDHPRF